MRVIPQPDGYSYRFDPTLFPSKDIRLDVSNTEGLELKQEGAVKFIGFISHNPGIRETEKYPTYDNNHEKRKHFLICESCFWYASSFSTPRRLFKIETIPRCPLCDSDKIRIIPLSLRGLRV
jgi:hypothetical protein